MLNIKSIVERYQTPLYLYRGDIIEEKYHQLKACFPGHFTIYYMMKSNPSPGLCRILLRLGAHIHITSSGELYLAIKSGFPPDKIIFSGPGKTSSDLDYAVRSGIYCIIAESPEELDIINSTSRERNRTTSVALRINPGFRPAGTIAPYAGKSMQFGIDEDRAGDVFKMSRTLTNIEIIGIHIFSGTQILSSHHIVHNMEKAIELALSLSNEFKPSLKFLNLGGGLGIPYTSKEKAIDFRELAVEFGEVWTKYKAGCNGIKMAIESGRFLTAESGKYLVRVLYWKKNKEKVYLVCDGGVNFFNNCPFLGRYARFDLPVYKESSTPLDTGKDVFQISGPLCTPLDILGNNVPFASAEAGDILCIPNSGAYGLTGSPFLFLSHPSPLELLVYRGNEYILRKRGNPGDFLAGQAGMQFTE